MCYRTLQIASSWLIKMPRRVMLNWKHREKKRQSDDKSRQLATLRPPLLKFDNPSSTLHLLRFHFFKKRAKAIRFP